MKIESVRLRRGLPVIAFGTSDPLHGEANALSRGGALAATAVAAVAVTMTDHARGIRRRRNRHSARGNLPAIARPVPAGRKDRSRSAGTKPIDTALTAAVPINVNTTRRERFMEPPALRKGRLTDSAIAAAREASESGSFHGIVQRNCFSRRRRNAT